jgi:hypothetical protein
MDASKPTLGAPVFTPPGPATIQAGSTAAIAPAAGSPTDVQIYYATTGAVPTPTNGTLYVGPIQISFPMGTTETVIAIAHDPSGANEDSLPGTAVYTEQPMEAGSQLPPVTFSQQSSTQNNDFPLGLSDTPGANICYSIDGVTTPTCTAAGTCVSPSLTYNQVLQINGTLPPNPATGSVTVTAIACEAGLPSSTPVSQTFVLQVAQPTMVLAGNAVPAGTGVQNVPWPTGTTGLQPTIQTATQASITVTDPVVLWYTLGGTTAPTCTTGNGGVSVTNPTTFNGIAQTGNGATPPVQNTNQTYEVIGCKQGYLPSTVNTFPVTIQLRPPVLLPTGTYDYVANGANPVAFNASEFTPVSGVAGQAAAINDTANFGGGTNGATGGPNGARDWVCSNNNGAASCGTTVNTCGAGQFATWTGNGTAQAGASTPAPIPFTTVAGVASWNPSPTTTLNSVACALNVNASATATAAYTLQFAQPFLVSNNALPTPTGTVPGWDNLGAGTPAGSPVQAMSIPSGATTPYGGFTVYDVGDTGNRTPTGCTNAAGTPPNWGCTATAFKQADYYCWAKNATATCITGTVTPTTNVAAGCSQGSGTNGGGGGIPATPGAGIAVTPGPNSTGTMNVVGGDFISVIGCEFSSAVPPARAVYNTSVATKVTFSAAGSATAPTIAGQTAASNQQAIVPITNNDTTTGGSNICITTDGSTPTCNTAGQCCGAAGGGCGGTGAPNAKTYCWNGGNKAWQLATAGGCTPTGTPASTTNVVTIPATTFQGTAPPEVQLDGEVVNAIACNPTETPSPVATQTFHFTVAEPDFTSPTQGATVGNLNAGGVTLGVGQTIDLSTISNFDTQPTGASVMSIHYSWTAAATCGSPTSTTVKAILPISVTGGVPGPVLTEPTSAWFALPTATQGNATLFPTLCNGAGTPAYQCPAGPTGITNGAVVPNPGTATSLTLSAIACGENTTGQISSIVRNATFPITSPAPVIVTDQATCTAAQNAGTGGQSCPATSCWTTPGASIANTVCPAQPTWSNTVNVNVVVPPAPSGTNPALCYTTNGTTVPACNTTGGCANGAGTLVPACVTGTASQNCLANGTMIVPFTIDGTTGASNQHLISGSTIQAVSCIAGVTPPAVTKQQFTLNTSPVVFAPASGTLTCGAPPNPNLTLTQDVTTNATQTTGGPTKNEVVCYTQNGKPPSYTPACSPTTDVNGASTTCTSTMGGTQLNAGGAACNCTATQAMANICVQGTTTCPTINLVASNNPITWQTCVPGANYSTAGTGESGTNSYTVPAYVDKITVDGSLSEWDTANTTQAEVVPSYSFVACTGNPGNGNSVPCKNQAPVVGSGTSGATNFNPNGGASPGNANKNIAPYGFLTYDATNLYLGFAYCPASILGATTTPQTACNASAGVYPPAASSAFGFFIGANPGPAASGATTDLAPLGGNGGALHGIDSTAGIQWAVVYPATGGNGPITGTATWGGPVKGWDTTKTFTATAAQDSAIWTHEISIPLSTFGATLPSTLTAYGVLYGSVSSAASVEFARWPGFQSFVSMPSTTPFWAESNPPLCTGTNCIPGSSPTQFADFFFEQPTSCVTPVNTFTQNPLFGSGQTTFPVSTHQGSPTEF